MTLVTMSRKEFSRIKILQDVSAGSLSIDEAAALLRVTRRQLFRIQRAFRYRGAAALASQRRGQPGNRRFPVHLRQETLAIIRERYVDFGPTLAAEKLAACHGLSLSRETLRQWMMAEGLWCDRKERLKAVHQPRPRRDCVGELVQVDGSEHWWFEERGPQCSLLVYVDDATSRLMHLKFVQSESTFSYFAATREYLDRHGKPVAFYSDKHGVFRVNKAGAVGGDGMTQFGRALHEINIDILCANTPQAKGRVERANKTLQDRLVKELRLQGISTIDAANELLPGFLTDYNARFAKEPRDGKDLHRPLSPDDDLGEVFTWREERTVSNSLTLQYDKVLFLLEPTPISSTLRHKRVTVADYPDGRLKISYNGVDLAYRRLFDKVRQVDQGAITDSKRLGAVLSAVKAAQQQNGIFRSERTPRRMDQRASTFSQPNGTVAKLVRTRRAEKRRPPSERLAQRLPFGLNPDALDPATAAMLRLVEQRNREADNERSQLNRRRLESHRKHALAANPDQKDGPQAA
jgi:hypothetical protein